MDETHRSVFVGIADHNRRALLEALLRRRQAGEDPTSITDLAVDIGVSRSTASRHLRVLCDTGLVRCTGRYAPQLHSLNLEAMFELDDWILPFVDALDGQTASKNMREWSI